MRSTPAGGAAEIYFWPPAPTRPFEGTDVLALRAEYSRKFNQETIEDASVAGLYVPVPAEVRVMKTCDQYPHGMRME